MSKQRKERLDKLLVARGLAPTRARAQAMVLAGEVEVDGRPAAKPGMSVPLAAELTVAAPLPYVSRGGYKLAAALDAFGIDVSDAICADVGACTGGFTDVLLQRGAGRVYAIDVGYGQLDWRLRQDRRVVVMERTNARYLEALAEPVDLAVVDVSFISLKLILPAVVGWLAPGASIVALIKPQFEAGPAQVGRGGIVRDAAVRRQVLADVLSWAHDRRFSVNALARSPITGVSGNIEYLAWLQVGRGQPDRIASLIDAALEDDEPST